MYKKIYWNMLGREYIDHVCRLSMSAHLGGTMETRKATTGKQAFMEISLGSRIGLSEWSLRMQWMSAWQPFL